MTICPKCGLDNRPGELVCARCTEPLVPGIRATSATKRIDATEPPDYVAAGTSRFPALTRLQIHVKGEKEPITVSLDKELTIGRGGADVDLTRFGADELGVSRIHAKIARADGSLTITDLSSNGTWVNGKRLDKNKSEALQEGVHIFLCKLEALVFFAS